MAIWHVTFATPWVKVIEKHGLPRCARNNELQATVLLVFARRVSDVATHEFLKVWSATLQSTAA